ncbi:hypothetical protein [Acidaminobacter hydrogenoformans]|uniref:Phage tail tube protein, GTA-gp10 n=1 Tax=Acidaminobacter hydrogenoformans DSM 2784 TaxID=1120920 RepID=A0A1G5S3Q5_9FIRM|nr:hypothetical protein [Acidaminobacter hydrogenoformans]SCZ80391.1 hypothetical protein SAMN03080599_02247 [Acidaminobacter hydrogenoformans DSM 2784]
MARPSIPIKLDKIRNLRFGMRAIANIEDNLNIKISKFDLSDVGMKDLAVFLWAGLAHEDPVLTPDDVMDLIDEHLSIKEAVEILGKAIDASFGTTEKNA